MGDAELLRRYAEERSENVFGEFVQRHINLVYSAALRQVSDPHLAQDVAQTVFVAVASKAATIARHPVPAAWLFIAMELVSRASHVGGF
jgi:DNA-directed RNA polymerase specialized sigma24 family protein